MYFDIKYWYINYEIELDDLEESVREEMNEPGNLLGYLRRPKRSEKLTGRTFQEI